MSEVRGTPLAGVEAREARVTLVGGNWTASLEGRICMPVVAPAGLNRSAGLCRIGCCNLTRRGGWPPWNGSGGDELLYLLIGMDPRGESRILEPARQAVDQLGVAGDLLALSPARHVGDRPTGGVEADRRADGVGDALDDDLLLAVGQLRVLVASVAADERVGQLVNRDPDLSIGRETIRDRFDADVATGRRAVSEGRAGDPLDRDGVADRARELDQRLEQPREAVALDRLKRRIELDRATGELRQWIDLGAVEDLDQPEEGPRPILWVGARFRG